jgi:hypothetical protein
MPAAIDLDHQPAAELGEVGNVGTDGRLPPKMGPKHPV